MGKYDMKKRGYQAAAEQVLRGGGMKYDDDKDRAEDEMNPYDEMDPMHYMADGGMVDKGMQSVDGFDEPSKKDYEMEFTRVLKRRGYR
jgi:hypothetical protein